MPNRTGYRQIDKYQYATIAKAALGIAIIAALGSFILGPIGISSADKAHTKIDERQRTTQYNITEINRIIFPSASDWIQEYYQTLYPSGTSNEFDGTIPVAGYFDTLFSNPLLDFDGAFLKINRTHYDAASDGDLLRAPDFGGDAIGTKGEYKAYIASVLQHYLDSIPPQGQLTGAVHPPFGIVSGLVGWTHSTGKRLIAVGMNNAILVLDADELAKYPGNMNYVTAVSRNIVLARFGRPHSFWAEVEHFGKDGGPQDWIAVTSEWFSVTAGTIFIDATDLSNIHITNLDQYAPNGGLTDMSTITDSIPRWGNPGTPVDSFDPSCPKFKDDGGLSVGCHFLRKEHGYVNVTGRSIIWFMGCLPFSQFEGTSCPSPPYSDHYEFDLNPPVTLDTIPTGLARKRRRETQVKRIKRKPKKTRKNTFGKRGVADINRQRSIQSGPKEVYALDVSNPAIRFRVPGAIINDGTYCHDFTPMHQNGKFYGICSEIVGEYWGIYDITDLSAVSVTPQVSRFIPPVPYFNPSAGIDSGSYGPGSCYAHSLTFNIGDTIGYGTCENNGQPLFIIDFSNVLKPRLIKRVVADGVYGEMWHEGQPERPRQGADGIDVLYMAMYVDGVIAVDTYGENAANPVKVGHIPNAGRTLADGTMIQVPEISAGGTSGFWGVHPIHGWLGYIAAASYGDTYLSTEEALDYGLGGDPFDVIQTIENPVKINPDCAVVLMRSVPLK